MENKEEENDDEEDKAGGVGNGDCGRMEGDEEDVDKESERANSVAMVVCWRFDDDGVDDVNSDRILQSKLSSLSLPRLDRGSPLLGNDIQGDSRTILEGDAFMEGLSWHLSSLLLIWNIIIVVITRSKESFTAYALCGSCFGPSTQYDPRKVPHNDGDGAVVEDTTRRRRKDGGV